ncbi:MAG: dihydrodipicolinate synthase family protein [Armatimonadota bacterium]
MKELGILVPVVTPCGKSGEVDADGLKSVCGYMLGAGCNAIFAAGSTGRGPWFSRDDRATICRTVAECSDVPLFAGCMASGLSEMLENARAMKDSGADIAVLTAPGYFAYSQSEIESIFLRFADASPLPVMIYDIPAFTGTKLDMGMVERLARHGNVTGFKDSSGDMQGFTGLADALCNLGDFYLLQGKEHLLADSLLSGASGFVVSLVHAEPELFVRLYRAARAGDLETAKRLQEKVTELMGILVGCFGRRSETSTMFHFMNHILKKRGICENILLAHEGETPLWIEEEAEKAVQLCEQLEVS